MTRRKALSPALVCGALMTAWICNAAEPEAELAVSASAQPAAGAFQQSDEARGNIAASAAVWRHATLPVSLTHPEHFPFLLSSTNAGFEISVLSAALSTALLLEPTSVSIPEPANSQAVLHPKWPERILTLAPVTFDLLSEEAP